MKTINKILATALLIAVPTIVGCSKVQDSRSKVVQQKQYCATYETKIKEGENLADYLNQEGFPMNLDSYVGLVKELNKDNKQAFVNYDGGQIRADRKIRLPDLNCDGKVAGKIHGKIDLVMPSYN